MPAREAILNIIKIVPSLGLPLSAVYSKLFSHTSYGLPVNKAINVLKPHFRKEEILRLIEECLDQGWTGLGNKTIEFEDEWRKYTKLTHAHFLSSNTVGLHLALELPKRRMGWAPDAEVISTPLTFVSTNHAILQAGLKPVFADIGDDLCLSPESVRSKISPKTKAVIFVGIGGNLSRYREIVDICRENNLWLVLDAAHMAGSYDLDGKHVGYDADVAVFSFQAVKNLPTADSGMICFREKAYDLYAREISWLGINKDTFSRSTNKGSYKWDYEVSELGYKYHGNSIMAAFGLAQLKYLDQDNSFRRSVFDRYAQNLAHVNGLGLIRHSNCLSSRHLVQCIVSNRDEFILALHEHSIYPGVHYKDNTLYAPYRSSFGTCPNSHKLSMSVLSLPCHLQITFDDIDYVSESVIKISQNITSNPVFCQ